MLAKKVWAALEVGCVFKWKLSIGAFTVHYMLTGNYKRFS